MIPIDVGRQLFVDDFLIAQTDLKRTYHLPSFYIGDRLYFYFSGRASATMPGRTDHRAVGSTGLAFLRRDGFASMDAGASEGAVPGHEREHSSAATGIQGSFPGHRARCLALIDGTD